MEEVFADLRELESRHYPIFVSHKKAKVYNIPASFDIETTSFYDAARGKKHATMYIWQFGFNGSVIYGRTWDEFFDFIEKFTNELGCNENCLIYIYVHNLSYEFQWIRRYFEWNKVFALKKRKVLYASYLPLGIQFCCSYILTNASLAHVGDPKNGMLTRYKISKLVGDLDYSKMRHSGTPLTANELAYCLNDVRVVMALIQEKIEHDGGINNIPLTNTGYVRRYCRKCCMEDKYSSQKYHALMGSLTISSEDEYDQNKRAFRGGHVHTGILHANKTLHNIGSADLTSSYPAEICFSYFPMSSATLVNEVKSERVFKNLLERYCCIFDIYFEGLKPLVEYENYLSLSKCVCEGATVNNGRIVSAKTCMTTLTELDYDIVCKYYTWDTMRVSNLRYYTRGYLPKSLIMAVLDLYAAKTELKGIPEQAVEYLRSKGMINATFGMMVTDIIRPEISLDEDEEWIEEDAFKAKQLDGYNKNFNRFLYYTWGVYVTAHARHNLFDAITEFAEDFVYADTDSVKGLNFHKHMDFFVLYNFKNKLRARKMCNIMDIPFEKVCPETIKGEKKLLGNWEIEDSYKLFKAAGAKRYMYQYENGELGLTVAGLNKKYAIPYLLDSHPTIQSIFDDFEDGFWIPPGHSGKQTLTYIDHEIEGELIDYLGNEGHYLEASAIHMENIGFAMSQTEEYLRLLHGITEPERR